MDLVTGIVKDNWNKDMPGKIQVEYRFGEKGKCLSGWLPVMTGYAGPGFGTFLLPETGSEVIVAFLHGNPNCPFVAGCLLGQVNLPADGSATEKNEKKLLRTKGGWQILLNEETGSLTLTDKEEKNSITLLSKDGKLVLDLKTGIEIKIDKETYITLEKGKITHALDTEINAQKLTAKAEKGMELCGKSVEISPEKKVVVKGSEVEVAPDGKISLKGQSTEINPSQEVILKGAKASLKPAQSLELNSVQVKITGTTLECKGSATVKVEAGGIAEIKGALLKAN